MLQGLSAAATVIEKLALRVSESKDFLSGVLAMNESPHSHLFGSELCISHCIVF